MSIVHKDLYSFLALELNQSPEELRELLRREPSSLFAVVRRIEESSLAKMELTLSEAIRHGDGAPLLAAGVHLTPSYVKALLTRQLESEGGTIGPVGIVLTEALLDHYRQKVAKRFETLVAQVRDAELGCTAPVNRLIGASKDLQCIEAYLGELVEGLVASKDALPFFLSALSGSKGASAFQDGIKAAVIGMAVYALFRNFESEEEKKRALISLGMAGVLQDISLAIDPLHDREHHPEASEELARKIGIPEQVSAMVRLHHFTVDPKGVPALLAKPGLPEGTRILVATNVFVHMTEGPTAGTTFETIKGLNHLAAIHYVDAQVVKVLCRIFLPKVKSYVIEKANRIAKECVQSGGTPILWPVAGDKMPSIFLCQQRDCEYSTAQMSYIARAIPFELDGRVIAEIACGTYFTCPNLTGRLKALYEQIQAQIQKQA